MAPQYVKETPTARVLLVGSAYDAHCRAIRSFLSANQVQYDWVNSELEPERAYPYVPRANDGVVVVADGATPLVTPNVRNVAQALGFQTMPKNKCYDVVIAGAGPAGMAAGVYGASEGLKVLIVERRGTGRDLIPD
jgi:thioredoxin reductase (NADPH)